MGLCPRRVPDDNDAAAGAIILRKAMMKTLQSIWYKIYPADHEHKWMPLIWLPFMVWFFVDPHFKHASLLHWIGNTLAGLFFIFLYLQAFSRFGRVRNICIVFMVLMAAIFLPVNGGACGFLIYAAAAAGFTPKLRWVLATLSVEVAILLFYAYKLQLPVSFWGSMLLLIILVGFGNHHWALSLPRREDAPRPRRARAPCQSRRARAHCPRSARCTGPHAVAHHPEVGAGTQAGGPRSGTCQTGDAGSRNHVPRCAGRRARSHPWIPQRRHLRRTRSRPRRLGNGWRFRGVRHHPRAA